MRFVVTFFEWRGLGADPLIHLHNCVIGIIVGQLMRADPGLELLVDEFVELSEAISADCTTVRHPSLILNCKPVYDRPGSPGSLTLCTAGDLIGHPHS